MHFYVHVPFCVRRCSYCDFSIAVRRRIPAREYVEAIRSELRLLGARAGWVNPGAMPRGSQEPAPSGATRWGLREPAPVPGAMLRGSTLYLGGGTPSLLPPEAVSTLLRDVFHSPSLRDDLEVTLEANPEDVTPDAARAWRAAGVNRVSLGAQSFDDGVLRWMHRSHDAARIGDAVRALRQAGVDNVSLDLIFGLPVELGRDWSRDLDLACCLEPDHLSLYGLTVEERTPLARWVSRGATRPPPDERYAAEYLAAVEALAARGYQFYEVSNAARPGRRSQHNSAYWSGHTYVGVGPAAHSFDGRARRWNIAAWEAYRGAIAAGRSPVASEEVLSEEQRELERVYLALRTDEGLTLPVLPRLPPSFPAWERQGWVEVTGDRLRCTPQGWLRLDTLVADLTSNC